MQRAFLHQHGRHRAAASSSRLSITAPSAVRSGLARSSSTSACSRIASSSLSNPVLFSAETSTSWRLAAHFLHHDLVLQQLLAHAVGVGARPVDLVDRDDHRRVRRLGVLDRLDGLRHHAVIGGHHQHDDVRHRGAAGAHGGERFMARRVEEGDLRAGRQLHLIGADMLGDATGLAGRHVGVAQRVQQAGLAMIDMAHDGDHRRPRLQIGRRCRPRLPGRFSTSDSDDAAGLDGRIPAPPVRRYRRRCAWVMVAITPSFISALTTSVPRAAIRLASSCTVIVSGKITSRTTFTRRRATVPVRPGGAHARAGGAPRRASGPSRPRPRSRPARRCGRRGGDRRRSSSAATGTARGGAGPTPGGGRRAALVFLVGRAPGRAGLSRRVSPGRPRARRRRRRLGAARAGGGRRAGAALFTARRLRSPSGDRLVCGFGAARQQPRPQPLLGGLARASSSRRRASSAAERIEIFSCSRRSASRCFAFAPRCSASTRWRVAISAAVRRAAAGGRARPCGAWAAPARRPLSRRQRRRRGPAGARVAAPAAGAQATLLAHLDLHHFRAPVRKALPHGSGIDGLSPSPRARPGAGIACLWSRLIVAVTHAIFGPSTFVVRPAG